LGKKHKAKQSSALLTQVVGGVDPAILQECAGLSVAEVTRRAEKALAEFDYERAGQCFRTAVVVSGGDAAAVCRLATFFVDDLPDLERAAAMLACDACRGGLQGRVLHVRALRMLGRNEEALAVAREANAQGGSPESRVQEALLLSDLGRWQEAAAACERACSGSPVDEQVVRVKAESQRRATEEVQHALDDARGALDSGELARAEAILEGLAARHWNPPAYHALSARCRLARGQQRAAELEAQGSRLLESGQLEAALDAFRQAVAADPDRDSARLALARAEQERTSRIEKELLAAVSDACDRGDVEQAFSVAVRFSSPRIDASGAAGQVLGLVAQFLDENGKMPGPGHAAALAGLYLAQLEIDAARHDLADAHFARASGLLQSLAAARLVKAQLDAHRQKAADARIQKQLDEAHAAEAAGDIEAAAAGYERLARTEGYSGRQAAAAHAQDLRRNLLKAAQALSARKWVEGLIEKQDFFAALAEAGRHVADGTLSSDEAEPLKRAAVDGIARVYPVELTPLEAGAGALDSWSSDVAGLAGFLPSKTRVLSAGPDGGHTLLLSGERLLVLDSRGMKPGVLARLPAPCLVPDKRGFPLSDLGPGGSDEILLVNFESGQLLTLSHRKSRVDVTAAVPLAGMVRETRQKVTRWFAPFGPEEQMVICQSAPGASMESRLTVVSARDGRRVHEEGFGYCLTSIRRISGTPNLFSVHRYPEPGKKKQGYFSFAFVDNRLKIESRFLVPPGELDGKLLESARWLRVGPLSGRVYSLQRCFDAYSGQLLERPLAFVVLERSGSFVFLSSDSSTLLRGEGELLPLGDVLVHQGAEYVVMLGRTASGPQLVVFDQELRLVARHPLKADEALVAIERGAEPGSLVLVSLVVATGVVKMTKDSL